MAKRRRKNRSRKKNLSTGAWVAIGLGIGIGVPAVIAGIVALYGFKRVTDIADREMGGITGTQYDDQGRPIPPIPPIG